MRHPSQDARKMGEVADIFRKKKFNSNPYNNIRIPEEN